MPVPQSLPSRLIGALFVDRGLVSESQIRIALEIQNETGQQLGQVLVERFGVSRKELASVVAEQWAKLGGSSGPEDTASWRRLGASLSTAASSARTSSTRRLRDSAKRVSGWARRSSRRA